jgi:predicted TIM-barrel fold metal-dependent hydrolase
MKRKYALLCSLLGILLLAGTGLEAQTSAIKRIDMHVHFIPDAYGTYLVDHFGATPDGIPTPKWSIEEHLKFMDREGIQVAMLSMSSPHVSYGTDEEARTLARQGNEAGAKIVQQHPDRFGLLATLPLPLVDDSIKEIAYALDVLHADGFTLPTNARGVYLGDKRLEPVFAELNRRHAVVTLHPNRPSAVPAGVAEALPTPLMEFIFDTTRTVIDLMLNGTMSKYPDMKIIIPHAGAVLPTIVDRIAPVMGVFVKSSAADKDVYKTFSKFYFDTAGICLPRQLPALLELVDSSHVFYGSDYPYTPENVIHNLGMMLSTTPSLTAAQRQDIFRDSALAVFPRLK